MLFLLFLFSPLPCQSQCPDCKDVSGPGPLAGEYQLAGTDEERCQDLCSYERGGELYCFERRQSEYQTRQCSCVECGDQCLHLFEADLYIDCGGACQLAQEPCNGTCQAGAFLCGDICMDTDYPDKFLDCDGFCQSVDTPCNETCPAGWKLCVNGSMCVSQEDALFKDCNGECVEASVPCDGMCESTMMMCNGSCLERTGHTGQYWTCQDSCIPSSLPCEDRCADGRYLVGGDCVETCDLCPDAQCDSDSDCQDNAGCFLYGDRFFCQCYLGWSLDRGNASTIECPHTGTCAPAGQDTCRGSPCYQADGVSVCPYCNATYGEVTYEYQTGAGFGNDTFNGNISTPMLFTSASNSCSLSLTWSCWYNAMEMVTSYSTVELQLLSVDGCNITIGLLTPLACPMAMPMI